MSDEKVKTLIELVKTKKAEIKEAERPNWKTNCAFRFDPSSARVYNIQVETDTDFFVSALAALIRGKETCEAAAKKLGVTYKYSWLGYSYEDWESDIKSRLSRINISQKKKELEKIEKRLDGLISSELRTKMELEEISKALETE